MTLKELLEQRKKVTMDMRAVLDTAGKEKRELTSDEETRYAKMEKDVDALQADIRKAEAAEARRQKVEDLEKEINSARGRTTQPGTPGREDESRGGRGDGVEIEVRGRPQRLRLTKTDEVRRATPEYLQAFRDSLQHGVRGLQYDLDVEGGFVTAPEQIASEIIADVDDAVLFRSVCRRFTLRAGAKKLTFARRTGKAQTFAWGTELQAPTADTSMRFGTRSLEVHDMTGEVLVSRDLLDGSVINIEQYVRQEMARDAGELEEQGFVSGSGAGQPLGVFTVSDDGIPTSRDVSTGNLATAVTFDGLISAFYTLKQSYRGASTWMFHRDLVSQIRRIKDGNGNYIWEASVKTGEQDTIMGRPVVESEWIPKTATTGLYVGILGDFSHYAIVDSLLVQMQRLMETNARQNQDAFLVRRKVDGMPLKAEAFVRVKLA